MLENVIRQELDGRRQQLQAALARPSAPRQLASLLAEVDEALRRVEAGTYGLCETCGDPIEADRLLADPLLRFCLDHLTPEQQTALERDLQLAARIQQGLLPPADLAVDGWDWAYRYEPAHLVSGDYCDVIAGPAGDRFFLLGDVAGKGVAASMLMAQLHAMFRSLIPVGLPVCDLLERASAIFCDSTLPTHYATLACVRAQADGAVEICNAGHLPPVLVRTNGTTRLLADASGLPIGMFCAGRYESFHERLGPGDALVLCTDGVLDTENAAGEEFGFARLERLASRHAGLSPAALVAEYFHALDHHRAAGQGGDDVTMLVVRRR